MKSLIILALFSCCSAYPHDLRTDCPYKGDGYCDDSHNNKGCDWDGGDCCGPNVKTDYCFVCACLGVYKVPIINDLE